MQGYGDGGYIQSLLIMDECQEYGYTEYIAQHNFMRDVDRSQIRLHESAPLLNHRLYDEIPLLVLVGTLLRPHKSEDLLVRGTT